MICKECGANLPDGVSFCRYCGSKVGSAKEKSYCPSCGSSIDSGVKFCRNCGFDILHGRVIDDLSDDDEAENESGVETNLVDAKKTGFEFWYNFDEVTKIGIFGIGFLAYLIAIGIVARNTLAIVMGSLQLAVIIYIELIHHNKIKINKKWVRYILIAALAIFSVIYARSFYISK